MMNVLVRKIGSKYFLMVWEHNKKINCDVGDLSVWLSFLPAGTSFYADKKTAGFLLDNKLFREKYVVNTISRVPKKLATFIFEKLWSLYATPSESSSNFFICVKPYLSANNVKKGFSGIRSRDHSITIDLLSNMVFLAEHDYLWASLLENKAKFVKNDFKEEAKKLITEINGLDEKDFVTRNILALKLERLQKSQKHHTNLLFSIK